jgi:drug/metabolite transporter (DMT)-like permease
MKIKTIGILATLGAAIAWAFEPIFAKLSYTNANFLETSTVRAMFVALIALSYVFITNKGNLKVNKKQFSMLVYIALAGTLFADLMYLFALTKVPVINAVLIGHMQPIFIVFMGFFWLKEDRLTKFDYTGIFFMIIAGLLVTTKTLTNLSMLRLGSVYDLFVLSATIAWATTGVVMRKYLKDMNAGVVTFYRFFISSIVFVIYLFSTSSVLFSNIYQILVGVIVGAGYILYYEGLKRIKAAQSSALELSTPFFAVLLGFYILGEPVTVMQIFGISLLFVGICSLSAKEETHSSKARQVG